MYDVDDLINVAKAVEEGDPLDWTCHRSFSKDDIYEIMSIKLFEQIGGEINSVKELIMAATMVHLVVENSMLNHALMLQE